MTNINIIFGVSIGLGKAIFQSLSKKEITLALTSKKNLTTKDIFYVSYFDNNNDIETIFDLILSKLKNINFNSITIYFNSSIYDKKEDNYFDKIKILNVNFFNQIIFFEYLKKNFSDKKFKLIFFSSFEVFNNKTKLNYYKLSKSMYIEEYERLKYNKNLIIKLFIIGGIRTSTYKKNISTKKRSFFRNFLASDLETAKNFIIYESRKNITRKYYFPLRYYYLNILRSIFKF